MTTTDGRATAVADRCCGGGGDGNETAADLTLFKAIGLHHMLKNGTAGRRFRAGYVWFARLIVAVQLLQVAGLYASANDLRRFASMAVLAFNGLMCAFKGLVLANNADRLREVLDAARYRYTVCGHRRPADMQRTGATVSALLRTFATVSYCTLAVWVVTPLLADVAYVQIVHRDGTAAAYRATIDNAWLPGMSETVYNWPPVWAAVYAIEVIMLTANVFNWMMFDCYLLTVCFVLNAQFRTLAVGYATIGRQRSLRWCSCVRSRSGDPIVNVVNNSGICTENDEVHNMGNSDYYEDLIVHIIDNQNIIKKYDDFFEIVRPVVITQVVSSSISIVGLILLVELLYSRGESITFGPVLRLICGLLSLTIEFYIYCYSFNYIEIAKCTLNFGLYSSNWTAMDLKFKKTLFMAMSMNSAHMKAMKLSPKYIINLKMFTSVMKMCYSMVSVILNSIEK